MINVNVEIKKSKLLCSAQSAFVYFPYNEDVLGKIKTIRNRRYIPDEKCWEIPITEVGELKKKLVNENVFIHENKQEIGIPENYHFKLTPYEYQKEGILYGLAHDKFILGDTQGIGKTMQSLHIAAIKKQLYLHKHCLIVCCVNGLKSNWVREIKEHTNLTGHILGTRYKRNGEKKSTINSSDKLEDIKSIDTLEDFFLITNVESFRDEEFSTQIKDCILENKINTVIIDEIHKVKNPTTILATGLLELKKAQNIMLLSGTLLVNSPLDLYMPMRLLGIELREIWHFKNQYCEFKKITVWDNKSKKKRIRNIVSGYKNLDELQIKVKNNILKRDKSILDLPDKIFSEEYLEMLPKQQQLYDKVKNLDYSLLNVEGTDNKLALYIRLRQITGAPEIISNVNESIKMDRMQEIVSENLNNNQKVIIFSEWAEMLKVADKRLKKCKVKTALVNREIKDKMKEIDKFRLSDDCNVILGTISLLGTGYSLPEANTIIFLDSPYTDSDRQQAIDRAHRLTSKHNITIISLICVGTVDERIEEILKQKVEISDLIMNGSITGKGLKYLLS